MHFASFDLSQAILEIFLPFWNTSSKNKGPVNFQPRVTFEIQPNWKYLGRFRRIASFVYQIKQKWTDLIMKKVLLKVSERFLLNGFLVLVIRLTWHAYISISWIGYYCIVVGYYCIIRCIRIRVNYTFQMLWIGFLYGSKYCEVIVRRFPSAVKWKLFLWKKFCNRQYSRMTWW